MSVLLCRSEARTIGTTCTRDKHARINMHGMGVHVHIRVNECDWTLNGRQILGHYCMCAVHLLLCNDSVRLEIRDPETGTSESNEPLVLDLQNQRLKPRYLPTMAILRFITASGMIKVAWLPIPRFAWALAE